MHRRRIHRHRHRHRYRYHPRYHPRYHHRYHHRYHQVHLRPARQLPPHHRIKVLTRMAYGYRDEAYCFLKICAAFPGIPG